MSLYDSLRNSLDFFSCSQPQHTKFASCLWQMPGSTLTDGQLLHSCHGFVAMSCQTVLEVQQIPCRGASRLSDFETSVQCQPCGWHLVHVSLMFSANQSIFLLFAHGWRCRPIFVSCCSENPYLRLTGSEFPFDSRVRGFAGGAPSDLKNDVGSGFKSMHGSWAIYMWVTFFWGGGNMKKRELGQCMRSQMYGIYIGSRRHA